MLQANYYQYEVPVVAAVGMILVGDILQPFNNEMFKRKTASSF